MLLALTETEGGFSYSTIYIYTYIVLLIILYVTYKCIIYIVSGNSALTCATVYIVLQLYPKYFSLGNGFVVFNSIHCLFNKTLYPELSNLSSLEI